MAELPEIVKLAQQMNETLQGKTLYKTKILQEKCTNIPISEFEERTTQARIVKVYHKGKWIFTRLDNGETILLSLGMGADILYFEDQTQLPEKYQIKVLFTDKTGYTARFWWFGKFLLCTDEELLTEKSTKDIGLDPFDERFSLEYFEALLKGKRTQVKAFLMNQKNVGGIGNMYMHDILFKAGIHPKKKISELTSQQIKGLYNSIYAILDDSRQQGSFSYEKDFFGNKGEFDTFLVGYKENEPCPECGTEIISLKTGSTSSFICPKCQVL